MSVVACQIYINGSVYFFRLETGHQTLEHSHAQKVQTLDDRYFIIVLADKSLWITCSISHTCKWVLVCFDVALLSLIDYHYLICVIHLPIKLISQVWLIAESQYLSHHCKTNMKQIFENITYITNKTLKLAAKLFATNFGFTQDCILYYNNHYHKTNEAGFLHDTKWQNTAPWVTPFCHLVLVFTLSSGD